MNEATEKVAEGAELRSNRLHCENANGESSNPFRRREETPSRAPVRRALSYLKPVLTVPAMREIACGRAEPVGAVGKALGPGLDPAGVVRTTYTFVPGGVVFAGILPATTINPNLPLKNATAPVNREFRTTWP